MEPPLLSTCLPSQHAVTALFAARRGRAAARASARYELHAMASASRWAQRAGSASFHAMLTGTMRYLLLPPLSTPPNPLVNHPSASIETVATRVERTWKPPLTCNIHLTFPTSRLSPVSTTERAKYGEYVI